MTGCRLPRYADLVTEYGDPFAPYPGEDPPVVHRIGPDPTEPATSPLPAVHPDRVSAHGATALSALEGLC